ncbi:MAG: lipopolysaccharide heptosyltransferase II [Desulfobacterales bacterium]
MNILIVKLSAIGDVIHTLPALNALRKRYPEAHITWLVEEDASSLIEGHKALNRVLISKRKRWARKLFSASWKPTLKEVVAFIRQLRDTEYDLIFDFHGLLKSGILIRLAKGKRKIGYGRGMAHQEHSYLFLNERIPPVSMDNHALMINMMMLKTVGIQIDEITYDLPVSSADHRAVERLLQQHHIDLSNPVVAINPVAKWETKLWSNARFSELADRMIEQFNAQILFTGSGGDRKIVTDIISGMRHTAYDFSGQTTLKTLAALYEKVDFLVSTDTGPMHLSAAMGTPVVALFGPTAPWRTGPFGSIHKVIRMDLKCSPCFKRTCDTSECMKRISVDQVMEGINSLEVRKMRNG